MIKIEKEPKLQFNRGNPNSPVPPRIDDHDLNEDNENQITDVESNEDLNKEEEKKEKHSGQKESKEENTEMLTF